MKLISQFRLFVQNQHEKAVLEAKEKGYNDYQINTAWNLASNEREFWEFIEKDIALSDENFIPKLPSSFPKRKKIHTYCISLIQGEL